MSNQQAQGPWWQASLILFYKLSSWIAAPVILALFVGKWLDRNFDTEPWLFLSSVGVAFLISLFGIIRDTMVTIKKMEKEAKEKK